MVVKRFLAQGKKVRRVARIREGERGWVADFVR